MQKSYVMLDIMKFVMALLVVSIHSGQDYLSVIGQIAVPFFFTVSAMFFFKKYLKLNTLSDKVRYLLKYEARLGMVYGVWILLYLPFHFKVLNGNVLENTVQIIKWTIMGNFPYFYAAWYMAALMIGIGFMVTCLELFGHKTMIAIGLISQIIVLAVISYNGLLPQSVFMLEPRVVNSGLRGMVYIVLGFALARNEDRLLRINALQSAVGATAGVLLVLFEQAIIGHFNLNMKMAFAGETLLMPLAVTLLIVAGVNLTIERISGQWFRQASSFIYFGHLMLIDLFAVWFMQNDLNSYQIFIVVAGMIVTLFALIYALKKLRAFYWLNALV